MTNGHVCHGRPVGKRLLHGRQVKLKWLLGLYACNQFFLNTTVLEEFVCQQFFQLCANSYSVRTAFVNGYARKLEYIKTNQGACLGFETNFQE